jgi:HPt (histidine-containing phosphotransfer) domain-containing protein
MNRVFDKTAALERMAFDAQLFREMIDLLRQDGPRRMQALTAALDAGDWGRVHLSAHSLKGLASNFNATRTIAAAAEVEKLARSSEQDGLDAAVAELRSALEELLAELKRHAEAAGPSRQTSAAPR